MAELETGIAKREDGKACMGESEQAGKPTGENCAT